MSDKTIDDQPPPTESEFPSVWPMVIRDMEERHRIGIERYGTPLRPHNGRDALIDAYQEALDQVVYLRQEIEQRGLAPLRVCLLPNGRMPSYAHPTDAGADLYAALSTPRQVEPGRRIAVSLGVAVEIPSWCQGEVRGRSGLARDHGLVVANGTIDPGYVGEVAAIIINHGHVPYTIHPGDRVAQLVITPVVRAKFVAVPALADSARGASGFGSSGR